jgi:P27 family predicted phage terminase small subunit
MTRGRRPTPTAILKARGTFREGRRNASEPQPAPGIPAAPPYLDKAAKTEYRRVAKLLAECGAITQADRAALAAYAAAWSRLVEAELKIRETGLVVRSPAGFPTTNPYFTVVRQAAEELRKWATELGLTPSSRTKIKTAPPSKVDTEGKSRFFVESKTA